MTTSAAPTGSTDPADQPAPAGVHAVRRFLHLEQPTLRKADVEARTGVPHERSVRWWRAMGFPEVGDDELAFREDDVEMVRRLDTLLGQGIVDDAEVLRLARLMGASFSRLVEAQLEVIDELLTSPDETGAHSSRRIDPEVLAAAADTDVIEMLETALVYVWRRHLLVALGQRLDVDELHTDQAVGFVDLSGFSRVTKKATNAEITEIIDAFETVAFDVVSTYRGRVVKLIGDEVMFVATDPSAACQAGRALMDAFTDRAHGVQPRGGLAYGLVVLRGGDYYGAIVNLASRLVDEAVPLELLVTEELAQAATACQFEPAGRRMVKGFDEPVTVRSLRMDEPVDGS